LKVFQKTTVPKMDAVYFWKVMQTLRVFQADYLGY